MLKEQKLLTKEEEEEETLMDIEESEDKDLIVKQKNREEYKSIVITVLEFLVSNKDTDLKALVQLFESKSTEEYLKLVPSIRKFSEVFIELLRIGTIEVQEMIREQENTYDNEEIEFDLRKLLVDEIQHKYSNNSFNTMNFYKCSDGEKITIKEKTNNTSQQEFVTIETLNCPNIIMKLE
ncbi:hypothetical protein SDC9_119163 [bioreactor metagenome]|uniref:Uncharacterized protein n=1 Tax=bioreactor metagenome TaxID=1076179 RepID=A0A645C342_9ZZZZ